MAFDYGVYQQQYREKHKDKTLAWRYSTCLRFITRFEQSNPQEAKRIRQRIEAEPRSYEERR